MAAAWFVGKLWAASPRMVLRLLLAWLACVPAAALLVGSAPTAGAYAKLQGVPLTRASDAATVELTNLWRKDVAFGLGGLVHARFISLLALTAHPAL